MFNAYDSEWQRTHDIESKASSSIGFTGIIFTLIIGTVFSFLADSNEVVIEKTLFSSIYSIIIIFLIISSMVLSIIYGTMALTVKEWRFPLADKFIEMCKSDQKDKELISKIYSTYVNIIVANGKTNSKIASYVTRSQRLFLLTIILIALYFFSILNSFM